MLLILYLLAFLCLGLIQECHAHYAERNSRRIRFKLFALERELIRDSTQKIKSVQHIKTYYVRYPSFHTAERIFNIRRKMARMIRLYVTAYDDWEQSVLSHTRTLSWLQELGTDIDHLVEMIVEWERNPYNTMMNVGGMVVPEQAVKDAIAGLVTATMPNAPSIPPGVPGRPREFLGYPGNRPGNHLGNHSGTHPGNLPGKRPENQTLPTKYRNSII